MQKRALKKTWEALAKTRNWDDPRVDTYLLANPKAFGQVLKGALAMLGRGEESAKLVSYSSPHL